MSDTSSLQSLLELLRAGQPEDKLNVDTSTIKYALYARKSTQADDKQARSISDQIKDCIDRVMTPAGITPVKVIKEQFSAKEPDTRVHFMELIKDIKAGRINGLIAWHPDRLARNMKDAGEIIDLLDKGTLRDLRFATSTFENNPTGKMLLGISFVLSKQYSEHLSESVIRGNRRLTEDDGVYLGKYKHGYYIDTNRHLIPDENTFTLVQKMFTMRLGGTSQKEILQWINKQDYKLRKRNKDPEPYVWDKDDVSELLRDTTYVGILKWGENSGLVNLVDKYDFTPMIEVKDFLKINKIDKLDSAKVKSLTKTKGGDIRANLLRSMVYCGICRQILTSMVIDKKKGKAIIGSYYYYKCETEKCKMRNKSARANLVISAAKEYFANNLLVTKENYDIYVANAKKAIKQKNTELESEIGRLTSRIGESKRNYEQTKSLLLSNKELAEHYNLDTAKEEINSLSAELSTLTNRRNRSKEAIVTYEEYLKLLSSTPVILGKIQDMEVMDAFLRIFFSNFTIIPSSGDFKQGSRVVYKLKEPWNGFSSADKLSLGAGTGTLTLDLFHGKEAL